MFIIPETERRCFEFELGGAAYSVPVMENLPARKVASLMDLKDGGANDYAVAMWLVSEVFEPACPGIADKLDQRQLNALLSAYIEESSVTPGE